MKKDLFFVCILCAFCVSVSIFVCCQAMENTYKTLDDYRRFVDYIQETNEPFEVACETDYYTTLIQEDRND